MLNSLINAMYRLIFYTLLCCATVASQAQNYADIIRNNPAMGATNMMCYHFDADEYTPAPKGYDAFYISHYGRHGSRYQSSDKYASSIWPILRKADSLGIFTEAGEAFYNDFNAYMTEQQGMYGMLTELGAQEQRGIAKRMAYNFPSVFKGRNNRTKVVCQSSTVPRCIVSMTNFVHSLDRSEGGLDYMFCTGEKYFQRLAYFPKPSPSVALAQTKNDSLRRATMKPDEIIRHLFSDTQKAYEMINDPYVFEMELYYASCGGHLSNHGTCLLSYFPTEVLVRNWEAANARFYLAYGMSYEMAESQKEISRRLLSDFIDRAEQAVADGSDIAADFRFGHDTSLLPLVGHIGIEGLDQWLSFDQVNSVWNSSKHICMGSNLQMVFYRNKAGKVIVKMLYNEKETTIPALKTVFGPYYKWPDLKKYLESLL